MKKLCTIAAALTGTALLVILYVHGLTASLGQPPYDVGTRQITQYLQTLFLCTGCGVSAAWFVRGCGTKPAPAAHLWLRLLPCLPLLLLPPIFTEELRMVRMYQQIAASVFPLILYALAIYRECHLKEHRVLYLLALPFFFGIAAGCIWFVTSFCSLYDSVRFEPAETFFMLVTAMLALTAAAKYQPDGFGNAGRNYTPPAACLCAAGTALCLFFDHDRIRAITASVQNYSLFETRYRTVPDGYEYANWFGYRLMALSGNLHRDFSVVNPMSTAFRLPSHTPLAWLHSLYGTGAVLLVCVLLAAVLLLCFRCSHQTLQNQPMYLYLTHLLILRTVLGLVLNLFLITSSNIGILMMGNPGDVVTVLVILTSCTFASSEKQSGTRPVSF